MGVRVEEITDLNYLKHSFAYLKGELDNLIINENRIRKAREKVAKMVEVHERRIKELEGINK